MADFILKFLGKTMCDIFRSDDIISRWGGDEFVVFMRDVHDKNTTKSRIERLRIRLRQCKKDGLIVTMTGFDGTAVIYLAGGCFWGMEKLAGALPGVLYAVSGYANGTAEATPTYELVCKGGTGFKETVRVIYDPAIIRLEQILQAYFLVIDPAVYNRQGNDSGTQYQIGVYFSDTDSGSIVKRVFTANIGTIMRLLLPLLLPQNTINASIFLSNFLVYWN